MWQVLLTAAVAGSSGFVLNHFLTNSSLLPQQTNLNHNANLHHPISLSNALQTTPHGFPPRSQILRKKPVFGRRVPKGEEASDVEQRRGGRRLPFCLKRRKIANSPAPKPGFPSSNDCSLFGWGLSYGIMYMMSAGKVEISKLNKAMDETTKAVEELNSELRRKKPSHTQQILDSVNNLNMKSRKISDGNHDEVMLEKTNSHARDDSDINILTLRVSDEGECGSSALTEEPEDRRVPEMDQLQAELEFELQKLSGCTVDSPCHDETTAKSHELEVPDEGCHETDDQNFSFSRCNGVSASELNQKLNQLLIEQQETQMGELESELCLAHSKLHEKEAELQALRDSVRRLTQLSLSTVSDDETEARNYPEGISD